VKSGYQNGGRQAWDGSVTYKCFDGKRLAEMNRKMNSVPFLYHNIYVCRREASYMPIADTKQEYEWRRERIYSVGKRKIREFNLVSITISLH
jgi:hypothetical protein